MKTFDFNIKKHLPNNHAQWNRGALRSNHKCTIQGLYNQGDMSVPGEYDRDDYSRPVDKMPDTIAVLGYISKDALNCTYEAVTIELYKKMRAQTKLPFAYFFNNVGGKWEADGGGFSYEIREHVSDL